MHRGCGRGATPTPPDSATRVPIPPTRRPKRAWEQATLSVTVHTLHHRQDQVPLRQRHGFVFSLTETPLAALPTPMPRKAAQLVANVRRSTRPTPFLQGLLGLGVGVADTAQVSTARAHLDAFSRLTAVPLYRGHTIYHHIDHTFHKLQVGPGRRARLEAATKQCTHVRRVKVRAKWERSGVGSDAVRHELAGPGGYNGIC